MNTHTIYSFSVTYKATSSDFIKSLDIDASNGAWCPSNLTVIPKRYEGANHVPHETIANKQAKARKRRRLKAQECLKQQRAQAQHYIEAVHQALKDLDFPDTLVVEIEGRLRAQQKLLGKIVGLMFPTLFGCRHGHELTRVCGWNKNVPSQLLGALPKRSRLGRLRRLGLEILVSIWRYTQGKSASTQSRWQWRWIVDDSADGGAASSNAPCPVSMGCSCWSSSAMVNS